MPRCNHIRLVGEFERHSDAMASVRLPGDTAIVVRGTPRAILMNCPCTCGDILVLNLDRRKGPAWRIYHQHKRLTIFPSYWRESGCESHFIIWNDRVYWCDWKDEGSWGDTVPAVTSAAVRAVLTEEFRAYEDIADQLEAIPWEVLQACNALVREGIAESNGPVRRGEFRLKL